MSKLVHVIHPNGSPRWERSYSDSTPDDRILQDLTSPGFKRHVGFLGKVVRVEDEVGDSGFPAVPHADPASGYVLDHPNCVIAVGYDRDGQFVETRRLKGPKEAACSAG